MQTVNERGKYFTDRVSTHHVEVLVVMVNGEVRGEAHLGPGQRIKDVLNQEDKFLALTNATVSLGDTSTKQVKFVALSKLHIVSVTPLEDDTQPVAENEHYPR